MIIFAIKGMEAFCECILFLVHRVAQTPGQKNAFLNLNGLSLQIIITINAIKWVGKAWAFP
jgi:hypothetical protein